MSHTLAGETYRSGFDPDIRALFQESFRRLEEIGCIWTLDPLMLESVDPPLVPKQPKRTTVEELLKLYEA